MAMAAAAGTGRIVSQAILFFSRRNATATLLSAFVADQEGGSNGS
jgi:hypothetical protein